MHHKRCEGGMHVSYLLRVLEHIRGLDDEHSAVTGPHGHAEHPLHGAQPQLFHGLAALPLGAAHLCEQ